MGGGSNHDRLRVFYPRPSHDRLAATYSRVHVMSSITIEALAVTREHEDGLRIEWLLEGGISALECPGVVLFASAEGNDMCDDDGSCEVHLADDFDAQRLRADTAEAELVSANADKEAYAQNAIDLRSSLDAVTLNLKRADNLISARTSENQQLRKLLEQTLAALNPTAKLSKSIRAALNPNPEAESHE